MAFIPGDSRTRLSGTQPPFCGAPAPLGCQCQGHAAPLGSSKGIAL